MMVSSENIDTALATGLKPLFSPGQRVLLIVPDTTRTAPVGDLVQRILPILRDMGALADVIVALGTHPALSDPDLLRHLGFTRESHAADFPDVRLMNHDWNDPSNLVQIGTIPGERITELTGGRLCDAVNLTLNRVVHEYDHLLILGPVFPHEIAGFSGGSKYLFPGISGPEIIDCFHWLGAVITNMEVIGVIDNPVRQVLNEAAGFLQIPVSAVSIVVHEGSLAHISVGPLFDSWHSAATCSAVCHVVRKPRTFDRVLSCAPRMYEDLWTGGKCMYKCEPVVEDGGELIIYAPHVSSFSVVHEDILERIGYHVLDYFLKQIDRFADVPKGIMAVSTYIKGTGSYENGVETPRIRVSVASQIPREACERVGLGYVDMNDIRVDDWRDREDDGILLVERAGETLYKLAGQE
jgi:nickel-dependent lactate racemase